MLYAYPMYCSAIIKSIHYLCACAPDGLVFYERLSVSHNSMKCMELTVSEKNHRRITRLQLDTLVYSYSHSFSAL